MLQFDIDDKIFSSMVSKLPKTKEDFLLKQNIELKEEISKLKSDLDTAKNFIEEYSPKAVELLDLRLLCKAERRNLAEIERQIRLRKAEYESLKDE